MTTDKDDGYVLLLLTLKLTGPAYIRNEQNQLIVVTDPILISGDNLSVAACTLLYPTAKETFLNFYTLIKTIPPGFVVISIPPYELWANYIDGVGYGINTTDNGFKLLEQYGIKGSDHFDAKHSG